MLIYLLSVCETVGTWLSVLGAITLAGCAVTVVGTAISHADHHLEPSYRPPPMALWLCKWALAAILLGALMPSTDRLIKAYLMVEGTEVVNAKNVKAAAAELSKALREITEALK